MKDNIISGIEVAENWADWCGEDNRWYRAMREFGYLGGFVKWYCGFPQSKSAIPLCFLLYDNDLNEMPCNSKLKDIKAAIITLRAKVLSQSSF